MAIDTTPGGSSADAYVSEAEAEAYHQSRVDNLAWVEADSATRETAIKMATRLLDLLEWRGTKTFFLEGALRWPREGLSDRDGVALEPTSILGKLRLARTESRRQIGFTHSDTPER